MATKSTQNKIQSWTRMMARWRRSGQTVAVFCQANQISNPSFYQWRKRLAEAKASRPKTGTPSFVPVTVVSTAPSGPAAEFVFGSGRVLRLFGEVSADRLAALAKALEAAGC